MKALQFGKTGSLDALACVDLPTPALNDGEVLVKVLAAGLNPSDAKNVLGRFPYTTLPRVPGRDFSGVVEGGPPSLVGKEVWGTGNELGFTRDGSHAEYVALPALGVAEKPKSLSFSEAASVGVPYTTALDALTRSGVEAGTDVLVIGMGAVGRAAFGLAVSRGAKAVVAVRRAEQAASLKSEGIPAIALGAPESLATAVHEHWSLGAEVIFDTTGHWLAAAIPALRKFGRLAVIAAPKDGMAQVPILQLYRRGGTIVGVNSLLYDTVACARMLSKLGEEFDRGSLPRPLPCRTLPLREGPAAYRDIEQGGEGNTALKIVFSGA